MFNVRMIHLWSSPLVFVALLAACDAAPAGPRTVLADAGADAAIIPDADLLPVEIVGRRIFNDRNLSVRKNQSCSNCHDVTFGFGSPNVALNGAGAVLPGSDPTKFGSRKPPTAAYATQAPVRFFDEADGTFVGGNFSDGRATGARLGSPSAEQALVPFLSGNEQGLPDLACVLFRIRQGPYAGNYTSVFGVAINGIAFPANTDQLCAQPGNAVPLSPDDRRAAQLEYDNVGRAVAAFEASPAVNQFSSKYDAVLDGLATLTQQEMRGLALYTGKANCAACHPSAGQLALFTDYTYDNIGVPANPSNPALIANPLFRDLGIGGSVNDPSFNGGHKVPTLRNLDQRGANGGTKAYMHNGVFKTIEQVVHFYNTRDVLRSCSAPGAPGFGLDCWPSPEVVENVNGDELGNLGMNAAEERALVAFLKTLNDGYYKPVRR